jgi:translation elongation factor EF-1beta
MAKILIVDDKESNLLALQQVLKELEDVDHLLIGGLF